MAAADKYPALFWHAKVLHNPLIGTYLTCFGHCSAPPIPTRPPIVDHLPLSAHPLPGSAQFFQSKLSPRAQ